MDATGIINQSTRRLLTFVGLALLEATPPALLLTLWGVQAAWGVLVVVVFSAGVCDWLIRRILPERQQRPAVALAALILAVSAARLVLPNNDLLAALFEPAFAHNLIGYSSLLAGLYATWRGVRMHAFETIGQRELFSRTMAMTLFALLIGGAGAHTETPLLLASTAEILVGFAAGLGTVALARAAEPGETTGRAAGWRGAAPTIAAIVIVLLLGLGLTGIFGGEARQMVVLLSNLLILLLTALLLPIVMLLAPILEWLLLTIHATALVVALRDFARQLQLAQRDSPINPFDELARWLPWLGPFLTLLGRLFPVFILLALVWFVAYRRSRAAKLADEERESLFSWNDLLNDLQGLFAGLRSAPGDGGLRAILANLHGADPDTRIRRSYLRMLIAAEDRELPRPAPQTPREFLPSAQAAITATPEVIARVTLAYERARYFPGNTTSTEAEVVERDWEDHSKPI